MGDAGERQHSTDSPPAHGASAKGVDHLDHCPGTKKRGTVTLAGENVAFAAKSVTFDPEKRHLAGRKSVILRADVSPCAAASACAGKETASGAATGALPGRRVDAGVFIRQDKPQAGACRKAFSVCSVR